MLQFQPHPFRIPDFMRWHVVVTSESMIDELRRAPDDTLSFSDAARDIIAGDYTLGVNTQTNPYHIPIIRAQLTSSLGMLIPEMRNEILVATEERIPLSEDWSPIKIYDIIRDIVCRASNRTFIGLPACRNSEYIATNLDYALNAALAAQIINLAPGFLKPIAGRLLTRIPSAIRTAMNHVRPIIEERKRKIEEYGYNYPDKPVDMLTWLMEEAEGEERTVENLTRRIILMNFAAIHSTAITFSIALFDLVSHPEYIEPIRDEVETIVNSEGWTKVGLGRMVKLDSFLKESQRYNSAGAVSLFRKAMKDCRLSDGSFIPKGATVSAIMTARQRDNNVYPNGSTFDGFRFNKMDGAKKFLAATSLDYLPFGLGRHACPGRFFAAVEMKLLMAHLLLNYDVDRLDNNIPTTVWYGTVCVPNSQAQVLFRKRHHV